LVQAVPKMLPLPLSRAVPSLPEEWTQSLSLSVWFSVCPRL
jgi:hypothetical protein